MAELYDGNDENGSLLSASASEGDDAPIENLKGLELRALIDEVENQVFHLNRSQIELEEALTCDPNDQDFKEAVAENRVIISRKAEKVALMNEELRRVDIAFQVEQRRAAILLQRKQQNSEQVHAYHLK